MEEVLAFVARSLVEHPEKVEVSRTGEADDVTLHLRVDPSDLGRVIGRQGRVAKAIRTVVKASAVRTGERVRVEIAE